MIGDHKLNCSQSKYFQLIMNPNQREIKIYSSLIIAPEKCKSTIYEFVFFKKQPLIQPSYSACESHNNEITLLSYLFVRMTVYHCAATSPSRLLDTTLHGNT